MTTMNDKKEKNIKIPSFILHLVTRRHLTLHNLLETHQTQVRSTDWIVRYNVIRTEFMYLLKSLLYNDLFVCVYIGLSKCYLTIHSCNSWHATPFQPQCLSRGEKIAPLQDSNSTNWKAALGKIMYLCSFKKIIEK